MNFSAKAVTLLAIAASTVSALEPKNTCTPGTNEVYCAAEERCIDPTTETCSFANGATFEATTGDVDLKCRHGQCNLNTLPTQSCSLVDGPTILGGSYLSNLNGDYTLTGTGCTDVECTGCVAETNVNTEGNCRASTGQSYCPEKEECIDPSTTRCVFGGEVINGPGEVVLQCANGRVDLELGTIKTGRNLENTLGGKYIDNLNGKVMFSSGAKGIATGCIVKETGLVGNDRRGLRGLF